jgi:hypothetical protein
MSCYISINEKFYNKYLNLNIKDIIYQIYIQKNIKSNFILFYEEYKIKDLKELIKELYDEKTKCIRKFKTILFLEIKKDYIEKYGIIKYLVEEQYIKEDIYKEIKRQENMLWEWNN